MKTTLIIISILIISGCSRPVCKISAPQLDEYPFYKQNKTWEEYIDTTMTLNEEAQKICLQVEVELFAILNENSSPNKDEQFLKIKNFLKEDKFRSYSLEKNQQKNIAKIWQNITNQRQKILYIAVIIAEIRNEWQKISKNCDFSANDQITMEKIQALPTIESLEKKLHILDILYDVCHQLSLFNLDIEFPD